MQIILATKNVPYPLRDGSAIRNFQIIKELSKRHEVRLVTFVRSEEEEEGLQELRKFCHSIFPIWEKRNFARKLRDLFFSLTGSLPITVLAHRSRAFQTALSEASFGITHGVLQIQELYLLENRPPSCPLPIILDAHNIEPRIISRLAVVERNPLRRMFYQREATRMARYEAKALQAVAAVVSLSRIEHEYFRNRSSRTILVPNGVEKQNASLKKRKPLAPVVLFIGSLYYRPNQDAVLYFIEDIWPEVQKRNPEAVFRIIGKIPRFLLPRLRQSGVEPLGSVADLDSHLEEVALLAVPLRAGAGTRLKILEAFTAGLPVVSTSIGAEGLEVKNSQHLLIRDETNAFAEAVCRLLEDPTLGTTLSENAFSWSQKNLLWENLVSDFDLLYEDLLRLKNNDSRNPHYSTA